MSTYPKSRRPTKSTKPLRMAPPRSQAARQGARRSAPRFIDPAVVFNDLLPDLAEASNGFAWACCPFHDDSNPSFSVNLRTGWYRCFSTSCGQAGPNIVSFVCELLAIETAEARRYLEAHYG